MFFLICFKMYFQPVHNYIKNMYELAMANNHTVFLTSFTLVGMIEAINELFKIDVFGIPNILLLIVMSTVFVDAYYGIRKSILESRRAYAYAFTFALDSPEHRRWLRVSDRKRFQMGKLQFTFFKCFTLLGYLFFAKTLLKFDVDNSLGIILGFTSSLALKLPLALFWYYDFKSIGDNSAYVYRKKALIFVVVETVFELKIKKKIEDLTTKTE